MKTKGLLPTWRDNFGGCHRRRTYSSLHQCIGRVLLANDAKSSVTGCDRLAPCVGKTMLSATIRPSGGEPHTLSSTQNLPVSSPIYLANCFSYVDQLHNKLRNYERQLGIAPDQRAESQEPCISIAYRPLVYGFDQPASVDIVNDTENQPRSSISTLVDDESADETVDGPVIDGMVEYDEHESASCDNHAYFGETSAFHFIMSIRKTASGGERQTPSIRPPTNCTSSDSDNNNAGCRCCQRDCQSLPQRNLGNTLLDRYFEACHPIWPLLLEQDTRARFNRTYTSQEPQTSVWLSQLNIIFALGCQFKDSVVLEQNNTRGETDLYEAGKTFYRRACDYIHSIVFSSSCVDVVQTLLLMATYQRAIALTEESWLTIGHATRMAQALGLHLDQSHKTTDPRYTELAKRLWWGCFCLDRFASLLFHSSFFWLTIVQCLQYDLRTSDGCFSDELLLYKPTTCYRR